VARLTSEPFSSVFITSANFGPPGVGLARGSVVGLVLKWPRWIETAGRVLSARWYIYWWTGSCGLPGRAATRAVK
jgi:hypothetical protein